MSKLKEIPASHYDILEKKCFAHVACVMPNGLLANNTVAFNWDGEHVRFSTLKARQKYKNFLSDSRCTVLIPDPENAWRYLEIRGHVEMADDTDRSFINSIAQRYMEMDEYPYDQPGDERVTLTVIIDQVRAQYVHSDEGSPETIGIK
jgi:PPOX class probable F420-dependent enzyme